MNSQSNCKPSFSIAGRIQPLQTSCPATIKQLHRHSCQFSLTPPPSVYVKNGMNIMPCTQIPIETIIASIKSSIVWQVNSMSQMLKFIIFRLSCRLPPFVLKVKIHLNSLQRSIWWFPSFTLSALQLQHNNLRVAAAYAVNGVNARGVTLLDRLWFGSVFKRSPSTVSVTELLLPWLLHKFIQDMNFVIFLAATPLAVLASRY